MGPLAALLRFACTCAKRVFVRAFDACVTSRAAATQLGQGYRRLSIQRIEKEVYSEVL